MNTRDRLAEALRGKQWVRKVMDDGCMSLLQADEFDLADAVLPVVEQIAAERAAEELRAIGRAGLAAEPGVAPVRIPVSYLFQRADALAPARAAGLTDKDGQR